MSIRDHRLGIAGPRARVVKHNKHRKIREQSKRVKDWKEAPNYWVQVHNQFMNECYEDDES